MDQVVRRLIVSELRWVHCVCLHSGSDSLWMAVFIFQESNYEDSARSTIFVKSCYDRCHLFWIMKFVFRDQLWNFPAAVKISHVINKYNQTFIYGKTCYRKVLESKNLTGANSEHSVTTSNHMEHFCNQLNWFALSQVSKTQETVETWREIDTKKSAWNWFLSIQKLLNNFNSFSPYNTISPCTIPRLLSRHELIGRAAARWPIF